MLRWALAFFLVALVAALFGFGGVASGAASVAKLLFFGFLLMAGVALMSALVRGAGL